LRPDDLFALELSLNFVLRIAKISLLFIGVAIFNLKDGGDFLVIPGLVMSSRVGLWTRSPAIATRLLKIVEVCEYSNIFSLSEMVDMIYGFPQLCVGQGLHTQVISL
jgi:hypothetical protein